MASTVSRSASPIAAAVEPFSLVDTAGCVPEFIEPGKPQQNGRHERMHLTLKAETTRPPAYSLAAQQRKCNRFIDEFNKRHNV